VKGSFQIVVSGRPRRDSPKRLPPSRLGRFKLWLQGLLVAAFAVGTFIAALFIASTITLAFWIAAAITLVCLIAVAAFRRAVHKRKPMSDRVIDRDRAPLR
jgi:membrane protein implicated in regulation of membrane protease activity